MSVRPETGIFLDSDTLGTDVDLSVLGGTLPNWEFLGIRDAAGVREAVARADVVVTNKVCLDEEALACASRLRLVCVAATGTNNVDLSAAAARGIPVCNVTGYATPSVVQHVFALIFALATRLTDYHAAVRSGAWQRSPHFSLLDYPVMELAGRTLGIVGYGELGRAVADAARCFGMRVAIAARPGTSPQPGRVPLDELLADVDVLSLHCPLTAETRGLIGARELGLMRSDALLINTARGGIVDEAALADALRSGRLGGAGIDVLTREPPREGSPLLEPGIPGLILTPHIAWASRAARQRLLDELRRNVEAFLAGAPRNLVQGGVAASGGGRPTGARSASPE